MMSERRQKERKTHPAFWRSSVRVIVLVILLCISTMEEKRTTENGITDREKSGEGMKK